MRAPFQILAIPYRITADSFLYCVFHRADLDQWQFLSGGGEDDETPVQAAKREILEESGIEVPDILTLKSTCCIPTGIFPEKYLSNWPANTYVVPEYSFAFACEKDIKLSCEHQEYLWLPYSEVWERLTWDSNRTALYELHCRLQENL